jgi:hypothetical protein
MSMFVALISAGKTSSILLYGSKIKSSVRLTREGRDKLAS